ncbi:hypothetical protein [Streptomyces sp. FH025]|uniref:hypothetical protein n=1 Tax=Streptomyces sp. FH025 TaxID=2815937 RepID=UPI001A9CE68C|nr:hypothetical protein [Streptomyces sp. FH025]MBO1415535.1 hypothetical protein [Streptomyces sp. FH025]
MKNPTGTYALPDGVTLHVTPDDNDGYRLEITRDGQSVRYDGGHSAREVQAFVTLLS